MERTLTLSILNYIEEVIDDNGDVFKQRPSVLYIGYKNRHPIEADGIGYGEFRRVLIDLMPQYNNNHKRTKYFKISRGGVKRYLSEKFSKNYYIKYYDKLAV